MRCFLLLAWLAVLAHSLNYSLALSLDNPNRLTRVFYDSDELRVVLYGSSTKQGLAFRSYDWEPDSASRWLPFNYLPSVAQYYSKAEMQHIIYASDSGQLAGTTYNTSKPGITFSNTYFSIPQDNSRVKTITATAENEGSFFATFTQQGSTVYVGNLTKTSPHRILLNLSSLGQVQGISWRPSTIELAAAVSHPQTYTSSIKLFNPELNMTTDLLSTQSLIRDLAFLSRTHLFFSAQEKTQPNHIWLYNIDKREKTNFVQSQYSFQSLCVRGDFLSGMAGIEEFVWNIKTHQFLGRYINTAGISGLSPDGTSLAATNTLYPSTLAIYKLCPQTGSYYSSASNSCKQCVTPCSSCLDENKCSSCQPHFYWKQRDFSCGACLQGCSSCKDPLFCLSCDAQNHWAGQNTSQCTCQKGFLLTDTKCQSCDIFMEGCSSCESQTVCKDCIDGYSLNSHLCDKDSHLMMIIVIAVAGLVVLAVAGFVALRICQKRTKGKEQKESYAQLQE